MGKTKPVWLVALQSAAEDAGMGNRLITREEFNEAIKATLADTKPLPPKPRKPRKKPVDPRKPLGLES